MSEITIAHTKSKKPLSNLFPLITCTLEKWRIAGCVHQNHILSSFLTLS